MTTAIADRTASRAPAYRRPPFDGVTIAFHWTTVLLVAGLFIAGLSIDQAADARSAGLLLTVHRSLGVTVWTLSLARACWRHSGARFPPFPPAMPPWQRRAAQVSEYGLYGLLLTQPITGVLQSVYLGKGFDLFLWRVPVVVGRDKLLLHRFHEIHEWGAWTLAALIGLHAAAALYHAFIVRDGVFESMAPIRRRP